MLLSSRKVCDLEDPRPCPWTTSPCSWTTKIVKDFAFCKNSPLGMITWPPCMRVKNGLLTDVRYYLPVLICISRYAILHCNPVLLSLWKVLLLEDPCPWTSSPCPCPQTLSPWQHNWWKPRPMGRSLNLSLIHIWRCRRSTLCRSRWSPYH